MLTGVTRALPRRRMREEAMASVNEDTGETAVAFVSGVLVGFATALLLVRMKRSREIGRGAEGEDYCYDGGDLFI